MDETEAASPERVRLYFYIAQIVAGVLFLAWVFFFRNREQPSGFRTREADQSRKPADRRKPGEVDPLAEAKIRKNEPLRLSGIRIDAPAHEILGVASHASPQEIQKAYRELMKRYHPDKVGPPGSRQWKDAQQIAEAINRAKEHLLKNRK